MTRSNKLVCAIAAIIAAAVLWGTTGTAQTFLSSDTSPLAVGAARLAIGALSLIALAVVTTSAVGRLQELPWRFVFGAGLAIGLYNLLFFAAVRHAGVGLGTALAIGIAPLWATVIAVVVSGRLPSLRQLVGQAMSIAGAVLLVAFGGGGTAAIAYGALLALGAGGSYACYSLLTSEIGRRSRDVPSTVAAAATFSVAALITLPVLAAYPTSWMLTATGLSTILFLGIVATGVSYALYTYGLSSVAPETAVTLALVEPLTAWLLATLIVGEAVSLTKVLGASLLLFGLWIVTSTASATSELRRD